MPKYRLIWNLGPGYQDSEEDIECNDQAEADAAAYEAWLQEAESQASYRAILIG